MTPSTSIASTGGRDLSRLLSAMPGAQAAASSRVAPLKTTRPERALLLAAITLLPLENVLPQVAGLSSSSLVFALLAAYAVLNRPRNLLRTARQPVFVAVYVLLFVGVLNETLQPFARYQDLLRIAQMAAGGMLIGALCRDRRAMRACVAAYVLVGLWVSLVLVATSYGALQAASASDFAEASRVRMEVLGDNALQANLNAMSFLTGQAVAVALALALASRSKQHRLALFAAAGLCLVATFLPLSRGGIGATLGACLVVMLKFRGRKGRAAVAALVLGVAVAGWVPDVVFSRLTFTTHDVGSAQESRSRVYEAAWKNLPEYALAGVGAGNFWRAWGYNHGWRGGGSHALGSHNCFIEVTLYWGAAGLVALLFIVARAYRCLPAGQYRDPLALALLGVTVSLLLVMLITHTLYAKEFSVGLGLLAAARQHLWRDTAPRREAL